MKNVNSYTGWNQIKTEVFWSELAACDHVIQIYENDEIFLDTLVGYVGGGINAGDCCIVVATTSHLNALHERLEDHVVCVDTLVSDNRYLTINAEEVLDKVMVDGRPDEALFAQTVSELTKRARMDNRRVRVFEEMVTVLWERGLKQATLQLEHLWSKCCENESCSVFCAYPQNAFRKDFNATIKDICGAHSKMIAGSERQLNKVYYKNIGQKNKDIPDAPVEDHVVNNNQIV